MIRLYHNPWLTAAVAAGTLCTGMIAFSFLARYDEVSIPVRGGESMPRTVLDDGRILLQTDPRWRNVKLGGSGELFGATGCTVCCVSMALAYYGVDVEPGRLNELLKQHDGFLSNGWLMWSTIPEITGERFMVEAPSQVEHRAIDSALKSGHPVMARVLRSSASHWVLIVGKEGYEYLMKDPLGDGGSIAPLSRYPAGIHSIRILRPSS